MGYFKELGLKQLYGVKPSFDKEYVLSQSEVIIGDFKLIVDTCLGEWDKVAQIVLKVALTKYLAEVYLKRAKQNDDVDATVDRLMTYLRIENKKRTLKYGQLVLAAVLLLLELTENGLER